MNMTATGWIMLTIVAYLGVMVGVGVYWSKKNNDASDFYLGGRKLGPFVTAMSAEASDMSGWLLMGIPGLAYISGIADPLWTVIGLGIGTYINWLIVAKRIRTYTHEVNAITLPDFFSRRYHDDKNILMCIAALVIIIFFIPYTASGFAACGKLFSSIFDIGYLPAMLIGAVVIVAYTATGGFLAASTTDLIQSIVMSIALIVVICFGINVAGGMDAVMENARELAGYLSMTATHSAADNTSSPYGFLTICSTLAWGFGYFGMPHILLRFMAIEDKEKLALSRRIATTWVVIAMCAAIFVGIIGNAMTKAGAVPFLEGSSSETIIVQIAHLLSQHSAFAAIIGGIILSGILASTMSTADSQLLAASSSFSQNLLQGFFKVKISDKGAIMAARLSVLAISVIGAFIARDPNSSVFGIVSFAWAGFGASFGPVVLASLFWKRSNKWGALAGMIVGGATVFIWKYMVRPLGGAWNIYELLPAFLLACAAIVVVSLLTKEPEQAIVEEYEHVQKIYRGEA